MELLNWVCLSRIRHLHKFHTTSNLIPLKADHLITLAFKNQIMVLQTRATLKLLTNEWDPHSSVGVLPLTLVGQDCRQSELGNNEAFCLFSYCTIHALHSETFGIFLNCWCSQ